MTKPLHLANTTGSERLQSRARTLWAVLGITVVGAALRLATVDTRSFWLDETTSVRQAGLAIPDMLFWMSNNVHPPLFHTLLHYWMVAFGRAEITVRAFSLTWGLLALPLTYWVASSVYDRRVGLYTTWIVALSPFYIWYAQEARMYTMMLVFALVSVGAMWHALQTGRLGWWALYAVATAAGIMTMYFFAFLIVGEFAYVLFARSADRRRAIVLWLSATALAMLPLVWWLPKVFAHPDLLRGASGVFNYGGSRTSFGVHFNELLLVPVQWVFGFHANSATRNMVAMWPLLITLVFVTARFARRFSERTRFLFVSGATGAGVIAVLGQWQPVALEVRYFTAVSVPLVILAARLLTELEGPALRTTLGILLALCLVSWADQSFNPSSLVKWDNRQAMGIVADGYRSGDAVLLIPYFVTSIAEYYLPRDVYAGLGVIPSFDAKARPRNSPAQLAEDLDRKVGPSQRVWLISTWQDVPRIAQDRASTQRWLTNEGFSVKADYKLYRIRVTLFESSRPREILTNPAGTTP